MLSRNTTLSTNTVSNGYVETFTTRSKDNNFRYVIILSKNTKGESTFEDFLKIEFENGFKKSCGCEIIQKLQHKVENSNKRSVRFEVLAQDSETLFRGYSDNLIHNQSMYNILFLCSDQTFTEFKEEYEAILNSFNPIR